MTRRAWTRWRCWSTTCRPGSQLAVLSRGEPLLPVARWRAEGRLAELGPDELAMGPAEAGSLLAAARVELADGEVAELTRRTEGWPVALYLAALSIKAQPATNARVGLNGRERFLVDYLQSALLAGLSPTEVQFLTRTAVLERLSGPLCDAVLDTTGSAEMLESLERSNLLVVPLDRQREWYRYHQLFRELLRGELERSRARAGGRAHPPGGPLVPAPRAGSRPRSATRWTPAMPTWSPGASSRRPSGVYRSGRLATVQRWFDWFDDHGLIQQYPAVAMLGAWIQALDGHAAAAERWADAAERGSYEGMLPDGSASIDGWRALLRAKLCRHGVTQMRADAELALTLIPVGSLWRAPAQLLLGISHLLAGDLGVADRVLAEAVEVAQDTGATLAASVALAERALLAIGRQDWQAAETLVDQARSVVASAHLEDCVTSLVVYAAGARVAIHHGEPGPGRTGPGPGPAAAATGHPCPALLRGPGPAGADPRLPRPDRRGRRPRGSCVRSTTCCGGGPTSAPSRDQASQLRSHLDQVRGEVVGAAPLTTAELRLVPLLATHLTFREMGQRLYLSQHTVKTQALSIYRKLGVSSRSQAVQRVQEIGLLTR